MTSALLSNNPQLIELKEVVSQSLTCAGVIGRYKAQLRASVYDVLHGRPRGEVYFQNQKIQQMKSNSESRLNWCWNCIWNENLNTVSNNACSLNVQIIDHLLSQLILEYLDYFDLKFTKSVLLPEANLVGSQ